MDDEYLALNLLEEFIGQLADFEVIAKLRSPLKALELLSGQPIDLLFLDIQMPLLNGYHLLKTLQNPPLTIFTTAYTEYAAEAFTLHAVDYLVKPFSFDRFFQATHKAKAQLRLSKPESQATLTPAEPDFITVKAEGKMHKVLLDEIVFVEGLKEYAKIILINGYLITFERLKNMEELLPASQFIRVHKSFIVAKNKVKSLNGTHLEMTGKIRIPLSREKKEDIIRQIFG